MWIVIVNPAACGGIVAVGRASIVKGVPDKFWNCISSPALALKIALHGFILLVAPGSSLPDKARIVPGGGLISLQGIFYDNI